MSRQVLDEQIDVEWYRLLKRRRSFDKVGDGFGRKGLQDEQIYHLLHGTGKTFHSQGLEVFGGYGWTYLQNEMIVDVNGALNYQFYSSFAGAFHKQIICIFI